MPHRIYAKPQSIASGHGDFALSIAADLLEGFEQYLGVNYSLSKMDQAAIPDFAAGWFFLNKRLLLNRTLILTFLTYRRNGLY